MRVTLFALICVMAAIPAPADEFHQHAIMTCDERSATAEISTLATYNDDPVPAGVGECQLRNLGPVKLKAGYGAVHSYGEGYGTPSMDISLWVNQAKVLSRAAVKCDYAGPCGLRMSVSSAGLRVCRRLDSDKLAPENCVLKSWSDLPRERDTAEYPIAGERVRPRDRSFARIYAENETFCAAFQRPGAERIWLPEGSTAIEPRSTSPWEYAGQYDYYDLDADNDGTVDRVVHLQARSHAQDADTLFVFSKTSVPQVKIGKLSETGSQDEYAGAADRIWPDHRLKPALDIAPWWNPADVLASPTFYSSAYITPLVWDGRSYFVATTSVASHRHWTTVLEPRPDGTLILKCAFQRVQSNR